MNFSIDRHTSVLLVTLILTHVFLYFTFGINATLEAEKYIDQAEKMLAGEFPSASKYYFYLPIICLIAVAKKLAIGYAFVVVVQSLIFSCSLILFYKAATMVFNKQTGLIAAVAVCLFLPLTSWNFYLFSESLFISLSMILFYTVCRFENQTLKNFVLILLVLLILIFTRPFGALFVPPLFLYFIFSNYSNKKFKLFTIGASALFIILMLIAIQAIFHGGEDMDAMKPFKQEHVICFVPNNPKGANLDLKYYNNGLTDILYYIVHNPSHFVKLMSQRLFSFFKFTRPWYSTAHNLLLLGFILPMYSFFLFGSRNLWKTKPNFSIYIFALLILYPLATTFQCDDWHSRFTFPILPPMIAIASHGLVTLQKIFFKKGKNKNLINSSS